MLDTRRPRLRDVLAALLPLWPPILARRMRFIYRHHFLDGDHVVSYTLCDGRIRFVCECGTDEWI